MLQNARRLPARNRGDPEADQGDTGPIDKWKQPAAPRTLQPLLGEADREVQEECRLECPGHDVGPEYSFVDKVPLAGVLQGIQRKRNQAEQKEVGGPRGRPAPKQDLQSDTEVDQPDKTETQVTAPVWRLRNNHHRRIQWRARPRIGIVRL